MVKSKNIYMAIQLIRADGFTPEVQKLIDSNIAEGRDLQLMKIHNLGYSESKAHKEAREHKNAEVESFVAATGLEKYVWDLDYTSLPKGASLFREENEVNISTKPVSPKGQLTPEVPTPPVGSKQISRESVSIEAGTPTVNAKAAIKSQAKSFGYQENLVVFPDIARGETDIHRDLREKYNQQVHNYAMEHGLESKVWNFEYSGLEEEELPLNVKTQTFVSDASRHQSVLTKKPTKIKNIRADLTMAAREEIERQSSKYNVQAELMLFPRPEAETDIQKEAREKYNNIVREYAATHELEGNVWGFNYNEFIGSPFPETIEYITARDDAVSDNKLVKKSPRVKNVVISLTEKAKEQRTNQALISNRPEEFMLFPPPLLDETAVVRKEREKYNKAVRDLAAKSDSESAVWSFNYNGFDDLPFVETFEYILVEEENTPASRSVVTIEPGALTDEAKEAINQQVAESGRLKELMLFTPTPSKESEIHQKARIEYNNRVREYSANNNLDDELWAFDYSNFEGMPFTEVAGYVTTSGSEEDDKYEYVERSINLMCRPAPHEPETETEKEDREKANAAAESLSLRTIIKAKNKAAKQGVKYIHNPSHDVWWQDIGEKEFKPEVFKADLIPAKKNETPEETLARDVENYKRMAKADRKTILAERRAIAKGLWVKPEGHETPSSVAHMRKGRETAKTLTGLHDPSKGRRDRIDKTDMEYKVYYKEIDPKIIFNYVGPWSYTQQAIRPTEFHATEEEVIKKRNAKDGFYDKLLESVEKNGFQDPIVINCGGGISVFTSNLLPKSFMDDIENRLICMFMGGSRLWAAQQLGIPKIPCIISDFSGKFEGEQELNTVEEIAAKFSQKPKDLRFTRLGIRYEPLRIQ